LIIDTDVLDSLIAATVLENNETLLTGNISITVILKI